MNRMFLGALFFFALIPPCVAGTVTPEDFTVKTTQDLVDLCTVSSDDPKAEAAIHFCHGYLVGAFHYHLAESAGPEGAERLVCLPNPPPSRNDAIEMFIKWVKARPQYMGEVPVETEFRFLIEKWPCRNK